MVLKMSNGAYLRDEPRILVTGGSGFIGSNLVRTMIRSGYTVLNVDKLTYASNTSLVSDINTNPRYIFKEADVSNYESMVGFMTSFKPNGIIHLAAETHVDRSIRNPRDFVYNNINSTVELLEAAFEYWSTSGIEGFRLIHVSTDEVYGSLGDQGKFTEDSRYNPSSPYSASKAATDHLVRSWYHSYGLPIIVTSCSNNYGPYQYYDKLVPMVISRCLRRLPIPIYGAGDNIRDWLYVEDHCEALIRVLEDGKTGETYNIGGRNEWSNIDLVHLICDCVAEFESSNFDYRSLITHISDRPGHDFRYAVDFSKIEEELDWRPMYDMVSGFRTTVLWYLNNRKWFDRPL